MLLYDCIHSFTYVSGNIATGGDVGMQVGYHGRDAPLGRLYVFIYGLTCRGGS